MDYIIYNIYRLLECYSDSSGRIDDSFVLLHSLVILLCVASHIKM